MEPETLTKNRERIKKHGEVFTPRRIIRHMINLPGLKDDIRQLKTTVLEPSAGEGAFLVEILKERLKYIISISDSLEKYENLSLLAISTLYGIELLEDNAQKCVMNLYQLFYEQYLFFSKSFNLAMNKKVLESAKVIISANIVQGDFLTKLAPNGEPIIFSEWLIVNPNNLSNLKVRRTKHYLSDLYDTSKMENRSKVLKEKEQTQLSLFDLGVEEFSEKSSPSQYEFKLVSLINVYREEMELIDG